ncbi:MAG: PTS transporter subunit EIIA [Rhodobacteraceae bacterium]|jgi:PTS system nitrogen regulatory IIA component|nr:PTS sugar transporter subunit IIA [Alphaproteobacteria bacterium]MBT8475481.1 PTS sugar transporter subunit IIA [Alphaproteobacteria bacterium]NNK66264.1 PTS transporter subunit EIIA [Paracoccaceae bacterium]
MEVASLLSPESVKIFPCVTSKKRLFQELSDLLHTAHGVPAGRALDALQERESLGPTGVGHGIALPHARLADVDRVIGLFVRLEKALEFDAVDRLPVDLVFALFAPEDAGVDHLKALALVSRTMRNADLCKKLRANGDAGTLHTLLTDVQATRAA